MYLGLEIGDWRCIYSEGEKKKMFFFLGREKGKNVNLKRIIMEGGVVTNDISLEVYWFILEF